MNSVTVLLASCALAFAAGCDAPPASDEAQPAASSEDSAQAPDRSAEVAIKELIAAAGESLTTELSREIEGRLGPPAELARAIEELARNGDRETRIAAIPLLARTAPAGGDAPAALVEMFTDSDPEIAGRALFAASLPFREDSEVYITAWRGLQSDNREFRIWCLYSLPYVGAPELEAWPAVEAAVRSDDKRESIAASSAIQETRMRDRELIAALLDVARESSGARYRHAVGALGSVCRSEDTGVLEVLTELEAAGDADARRAAETALKNIRARDQ